MVGGAGRNSAWPFGQLFFQWLVFPTTSLFFSNSCLTAVFVQGVYTNAAVNLGKVLDSPAFDVLSTAFFLILLVIWVFLQILTIKGIWTGKLLGLEKGWGKGVRYRWDEYSGGEQGEEQEQDVGVRKARGFNGGGRSMNEAETDSAAEKGESGSETRRRAAAYRGSASVN